MKAKKIFIATSIIILAAIAVIYFFLWKPVLWFMILFGPIILLGLYDMIQKEHAIKRNFPVVGHLRYILESFRPEIMQYFVETDTEGRPINRIMRSLVYERAKKVNDTTPFGTEMDVYAEGYEWMPHSIYAKNFGTIDQNPRIIVGGPDCKKPYNASILNISAMSFGALSKNAVMAMNKGAKIGGFAQNTGEGGLSPYHLKHGGDIIWQIGTGYFGCRTKDGKFSPELFKEKATLDQVKMIEIKISQGAKPGHGGVLPASKNTDEIAKIRLVEPHKDVLSPPMHSTFSNAKELTLFIKQLRDLSEGKPVGFKLCIGQPDEFTDICEAMRETGIKPDFITVDGGEGGTGAAPVEFSNSLGMPLREGLSFVYDTLIKYDLKKDIKLIASGKVISAFDMVRTMALGADMCNSARAMMMATGCIQALECNKNTCPTGVATQNKSLMKGLVVEDKAVRVANFHEVTIKSFVELLGAAGISEHEELNRSHIYRRINGGKVKRYDQIYPYHLAQ
ncbi:MAG: FMN-binding glutamate synthase family protein [Bacteroidales bacterium]|nr:FMN-binding glutamate synthase family protein [Bacteroidales bacterium]